MGNSTANRAGSSLSDGGCAFAADPRNTALDQPVFWTPLTDPGAILLQLSPVAPEGRGIPHEDIESAATTRLDDLRRVTVAGLRLEARLLGPGGDGPLAAIIILDADAPDRLHMVLRFWSAVWGRRVPPDNRLTRQRRRRAQQMLQAVDARHAGATYRDIASALFPRHRIDPASWAGDAVRETTIRLARDGAKLVRGGYRSLLRRPRRPA